VGACHCVPLLSVNEVDVVDELGLNAWHGSLLSMIRWRIIGVSMGVANTPCLVSKKSVMLH